MPDRDKPNERGLFGGVFARGGVEADDTAWLQAMLDAEAGLARALERAGLAPAGSGEAVTAAARAENFDPNELGGLATLTGNPVPGLARALARQVPQTAVSAVHRGATSQDIVDTAAMLLAKRALGVIEADLARAAGAAAGLAEAHRASIMIGRTLLQQAVPVTFGLVAAGWLTSLDEARDGLATVGSRRLAVQFGGAAGTLASLGEAGQRVAALLAEELGLALPVLPWHTDRLRIIDLGAALARAAAALGKVARDVTLLAQSEIGEVSEGSASRPVLGSVPARAPPKPAVPTSGADQQAPAASPRRGGSSAMPHKHNPVAAIAILGCTRQVPGLLATLASGRRTGTAARGRRLARRVGAADRPAPADRLGLELGGRAAARARRGHLADGRQPGRDQGPAARRARRLAAGRRARRRPGARPGGRGGRAGGKRRAAAAGRAAVRAQARGTAHGGRHHPRADRFRPRAVRLPRLRRCLHHGGA